MHWWGGMQGFFFGGAHQIITPSPVGSCPYIGFTYMHTFFVVVKINIFFQASLKLIHIM